MAKLTINMQNDKTGEIISQMKRQVVVALKSIGQEVEAYAKADCPVDTGRLRDSITNEVAENEYAVYVGSNVEYAPYVEYGDYEHKTGKKHFLRDACLDHADHYESILKASLDA